MSALVTGPRPASKTAAESAAQKSIERDPSKHADRDRGRIDVGELSPWIDQGDEDQGEEAAGNGGKCKLHRYSSWAAGAAVMVGEMPSAAWTGRHASAVRCER